MVSLRHATGVTTSYVYVNSLIMTEYPSSFYQVFLCQLRETRDIWFLLDFGFRILPGGFGGYAGKPWQLSLRHPCQCSSTNKQRGCHHREAFLLQHPQSRQRYCRNSDTKGYIRFTGDCREQKAIITILERHCRFRHGNRSRNISVVLAATHGAAIISVVPGTNESRLRLDWLARDS